MRLKAFLSSFLSLALLVAGNLVVTIACMWAAGALYFDSPFPELVRVVLACGWLVGSLALWYIIRRRPLAHSLVLLGVYVIGGWWLTLKPRQDRPWQPNVAETPWAEINGDTVTLHNVRNCEYRTAADYTAHWETRTLDLSKLAGLSMALTNWGSEWMAHPILCFEFTDGPPLAISIETRKEEGEAYSAIGGLFRQYELVVIAADERDLLRLRTNYRKDEKVYLYRTTSSPAEVRGRFMEYLQTINELHERPRWYNAVTTNCTTAIRTQRAADRRAAWDWRVLFNGKLDELCYERGILVTGGLPFEELKQRALINAAAAAADRSPNFSRDIREVLPGS